MNFALIMFLLLVVTGAVWLFDAWVLGRHRSATDAYRAREQEIAAQGEVKAVVVGEKEYPVTSGDQVAALLAKYNHAGSVSLIMQKGSEQTMVQLAKDPWWVEYPKSFFPVILVVFLLRSFLVEPFKIPSGSMLPTLLIGDFILVNKYTYGIRLPVINVKVFDMNTPRRGDVMVFRFPENTTVDYIKRVVGAPGDRIEYRNKRLTVNGTELPVEARGEYNYVDPNAGLNYVMTRQFRESLGEGHLILVQNDIPPVHLSGVKQFPFRENCVYNDEGFSCTVPPGHYFMMGDNRDSSSDSRYWGFVPDANVVGKAFMIWWNFDDIQGFFKSFSLKRIGQSIN